MPKSPVMCVRIPEDLLADLQAFCKQHKITQSDAVRVALRVYMDRKVRRVMHRRIERYEQKN